MSVLRLEKAGRFMLDLLYPPSCVLCRKAGPFLCHECETALPAADGERCFACWRPVWGEACVHCRTEPSSLSGLRFAYRYEGEVRRLVHGLKFRYQSCLAEPLGSLIAGLIAEHGIEADALVPVPLRGERLRSRGFNQASLLAREAGKILGLSVEEPLQRRGSTTPQARTTSAEQRRRNVLGAFGLKRGLDVRGRTLLLVDDVTTTRATLEACAGVLLEAGAYKVGAVTFAGED